MDFILFGTFSIITIAFIPLFLTIMVKLKRNYQRIYNDVKFKLVFVFTVYIVFLMIRLLLFADIKLFHFMFDTVSIYEAIPVYFTEIVITVMLSYVLFSISKVGNQSKSVDEQRR